MENSERNYIGEPINDPEADRGEPTVGRARETLDRAREKLSAGAAEATEIGRSAVSGARERATRAADFVREAESNAELKEAVTTRTEHSIDRVGDALTGAAPTIGRGAEKAAETLGKALHALSHPTGVALGTVAGTLGGWWRKAADERLQLPEAEDQACRDHFSAIAAMPPGMTYDRARPAYTLGFVASRNPAYRGRRFDEIDGELRQGLGEARAADYESVRDFTRYGYERGVSAGE
jgi:hypothetical protein